MRKFAIFGFLVAILSLNSCVTTLPPLMVGQPQEDAVPEKWMEYGAYYEYDELRIFTEVLYPDRGWESSYHVNKKLRILNRKGLKYGTIEVPKYGGTIADFVVTLWDPSGSEVALDLDAIREKYNQTGKIVVPKVVAGSQIGIKIVFGEDNLIYSHERWFEKEIPVRNARFSIFFPTNVMYECRAYGRVAPVEHKRYGGHYGYTWDVKNVLPEDDVYENRWYIDKEPHVMARVKSWYWQQFQYRAPGWKKMARQAEAFYLSPATFTFTSGMKDIVENVTRHKNDGYEKADAILAYVQDEISLAYQKNVRFKSIDLNKLLRERNGNSFEIAVLLKALYKIAGFRADLYMTRPLNWGGFDPDFPCWQQMDFPLVVVHVDGKPLVAFPNERLMALGEYPFEFHDLKALNIENGKMEPLPKSTYSNAKRSSLAVLWPDKWEDTHSWEFIYSGVFATFLRNKMAYRNTTDLRKEYFRSLIRRYDKANELKDLTPMTVERQGDINVSLGCRNGVSKTERADLSHYSLKPWFSRYFTDYDDSRMVNYTNEMTLVYEDSVLVKKDKNAQRRFSFECENLDNPLFCSECSQKQTSDGMLLSRKLTVKQADLTPEQMQGIYPDIVKLNRIGESYFVEKH